MGEKCARIIKVFERRKMNKKAEHILPDAAMPMMFLTLISWHGAGIRGENLVTVTFRVLGQWFFHYLSHTPQNMPKGLLNILVLPFLFPLKHPPCPDLLYVWLGHKWKAEPCFGGKRFNCHTDVTSCSGFQAVTQQESLITEGLDLCTYPEPENPSILVWVALVH